MSDFFSLKDQVAVVTGGTSGIGLKTAERFIAAGAKVVISGRKDGTEVADKIGATFVQCDVSDPDSVEAMMKAAVKAYGKIDILVSGVGTGGTLTGISRYIKKTCGHPLHTVAVEPDSTTMITAAKAGEDPTHAPHKIQGIGAGFVPQNLDLDMVDQVERVSSEEAMQWAHRLMQEEGILAGVSCGAAMAAAHRISQQAQHQDKTIVAILPDSGERYLTSPLFEGHFSDNETVQ